MKTIRISSEDVDNFINLVKEEYGNDISRSEAYDQLHSLIILVSSMLPLKEGITDRRIDMYVRMYREVVGIEIDRLQAEKDINKIIDGVLVSALSPESRQVLVHSLEYSDEVFNQVLKLFFKAFEEFEEK